MANATQDQVNEALDVAIDENGCSELLSWSYEQVAIDLINCNADFEDYEEGDLIPLIKVYMEARR